MVRDIFLYILLVLTVIATQIAMSDDTRVIRVAVIDTGFDYKSTWPNIKTQKNDQGMPMRIPTLCPDGHMDFTKTGLQDTHGHGTHVAGIIATYAEESKYCLIIIKNFDPKTKQDSVGMTIMAFNHAIDVKADIINYSGGGEVFSLDEYEAVQKALDQGIIIVTAAGNYTKTGLDIAKGPQKIDSVIDHIEKIPVTSDGRIVDKIKVRYINNLTLETSIGLRLGYYPANYDKRIIAVQNVDRNGKLAKSSRFGSAYSYKEIGVDVLSLGLNNSYVFLSGTSQATPKITAKIIKGFEKN